VKKPSRLEDLDTEAGRTTDELLRLFAITVMGVVGAVERGLWTAEDAVREFFNTENCLFVENRLNSKIASEIMRRGVQLPDLFDALDPDSARCEFERELKKIRVLSECLLPSGPAA
jgi:hypothetical protein